MRSRVLYQTARILIMLVLAGGFAAYALFPRPARSDFGQLWFGARTLAAGGNPYDVVGPGLPYDWEYPLLYPLPAVVAALPLAWLPARAADALFVGGGVAVLFWALTRQTLRNPQLLVFASFAMFTAAQVVQWSPWLTAAALMPSLGFLFAAKPSIGLALLAAYPSRWSLIGAFVFGAATVAFAPWWVPAWLQALANTSHMVPPVTEPGGVLVLLALLKWRRPEARLLAVLACVPHTRSMYEVLPLFLLVRTLDEGLILMTLTTVAGALVNSLSGDWWANNATAILWLIYMPCLVMVLRRPNEAPAPDNTFRRRIPFPFAVAGR
ncbi:MAG: hypothetical protein ABW292_16625 [Vicinamibacterales bacterium]